MFFSSRLVSSRFYNEGIAQKDDIGTAVPIGLISGWGTYIFLVLSTITVSIAVLKHLELPLRRYIRRRIAQASNK
jgi:hypothetical protein